MHVLGKVFLALTIVFALVDTYLSAVLMAHRTKWHSSIEQKQQQHEDLVDQLNDARDAHRNAEYELNRVTSTWRDKWDGGIGGRVLSPETGVLGLGVGSDAGIPGPGPNGTKPVVYIFTAPAEGPSRYIGAFELDPPQATQVAGQLWRTPYDGETDDWNFDQSTAFRVRENIPSSWRSAFADLSGQYTLAAQALDAQTNLLNTLIAQQAASQAVLDQRLAELNGDPEPPMGASQDVLDGLVLTIRNEETDRNAELETIDRLRHELKRNRDILRALIAGNQQKVAELPGAEEASQRPSSSTSGDTFPTGTTP